MAEIKNFKKFGNVWRVDIIESERGWGQKLLRDLEEVAAYVRPGHAMPLGGERQLHAPHGTGLDVAGHPALPTHARADPACAAEVHVADLVGVGPLGTPDRTLADLDQVVWRPGAHALRQQVPGQPGH